MQGWRAKRKWQRAKRKGRRAKGKDQRPKGQGTGLKVMNWRYPDFISVLSMMAFGMGSDGESHLARLICLRPSPEDRLVQSPCACDEVVLLVEEMPRVSKFFEWQVGWWRGRTVLQEVPSAVELDGMRACTLRQAVLCEPLREDCLHRQKTVQLRSPTHGCHPFSTW
jgi:hypothetical protein